MSVTGKRGVGIPIILLHDAEGTIVTIETRAGEMYRGLLDEAEDNMNCILRDAVKTDTIGRQSKVELVYIKGSQIAFICLPDMLRHAPMFRRIKVWKKYKGNVPAMGVGQTRGQAAVIKQAHATGRGSSRRAGFLQGGGMGGGPPGMGGGGRG